MISFSDPDGDTLTFLASGGTPLPDGMTLSPTGVINWTPTASQRGHAIVAFTVSDGEGGTARYQYVVNVAGGPNLVTISEATTSDLAALPEQTDESFTLESGQQYTIPTVLAEQDSDRVFSFDPKVAPGL